jgi:hypothetical protein
MPDNDWMNRQLRERRGTTVRLGNDANDAIRQALQPELFGQPGQQVQAPELPPEPEGLTEWRRWAETAAPYLDDQGRLPSEDGYTRPAADSFDAMVLRKQRRSGNRANRS